MLALYQGEYAINLMSDDSPELAAKAIGYLHALLWGVLAICSIRFYAASAKGCPKPTGMMIGFIGLLINIPINYVFIHGKFGMPELGGVGCGVATASVYWIMMLLMMFYTGTPPRLRDIRLHRPAFRLDGAVLKRLFGLGLPIALALLLKSRCLPWWHYWCCRWASSM